MLSAGDVVHLNKGDYILRAPIGDSAYGLVWRADGPQPGQEVALKLVNQAHMQNAAPEQRSRWVDSATKEMRFLRSLAPWDQRHIVRLQDDGMHEGLPVIALELMALDLGKYMSQKKQQRQSLPFARVLDWMAQINRALSKVHQYGWRYLDLKPANLLLSPDMLTLKLADFGASRILPEQTGHSYAGTANWQAPEQFFPIADSAHDPLYATDARSDYFALGALFYFLVTGGLPLRFCSLCGQAFRDQRTVAAQEMQKHQGGKPSTTFYPDEQMLFVRLIDAQLGTQPDPQRTDTGTPVMPMPAPDGTWHPQTVTAPYAPSAGAKAALSLLQALLAYCPSQRPQHGLDISRRIDAIRHKLGAGFSIVGRAKMKTGTNFTATQLPVGASPARDGKGDLAARFRRWYAEFANAVCVMASCIGLLMILVWPVTIAITFAASLATGLANDARTIPLDQAPRK